MKTKVIPVGNRVLIKKKKADEFFPGTKIIIHDAAKEEDYKGHVVGVGPDVEKTINVGDLVQYADYATPTVMKHMGEDHLLIAAGDIFAVIVNE